MTKEEIFNYAKSYTTCVISTSVDNKPASAMVDFAINKDLEIFFNTYTTSRKYRNLQINPYVSIVVGTGDNLTTLQYQGIARELEGHEEGKIINEFETNSGFFRRWKVKYMKYFKVEPTWVRLSDFSEYPSKETELNF